MNIINIKIIMGLIFLLLSLMGPAQAAFIPSSAWQGDDITEPNLPYLCNRLEVPDGHKVSFRVHALGVQLYRWSGTSWDFVAPEATLFANNSYKGKVGIHYAGPVWESNSGSKVFAGAVANCSPNSAAIPWLLLQTVSTEGAGIFKKVTHIQRVNTIGGLRPTDPGSSVGVEARVPYSAEYYFYRAED